MNTPMHFAPSPTLCKSLIEIEMDDLRTIARAHRWMILAVLLLNASVLLPALSLPAFVLQAWTLARLAGALRGERCSLLHLFLAIIPIVSLVQAVVLDLRVRRAFMKRGVRVSFLVSQLQLAQTEALVRRRRSVPPPTPGPRALVPRAPWELAPDEEATQLIDLKAA